MFFIFCLPNIHKPFLLGGHLPWSESIRDRTSFPLQKLRDTKYCLFHPMVAKVLVHDSTLTSQMFQPGTEIWSDTTVTQFIIQARQKQQYPMTAAAMLSDGSVWWWQVQCQQSPNQTFPVWTWAVAPNACPLLVFKIKPVLLLDSGIYLISLQ